MRDHLNDDIDAAFFAKWFANANFDPTGGILTAGLTMAGGAIQAGGTLAGGAAARQSAEFQAEEAENNAAQAFASSQRTALDTALKAKMAISRSTALAAGGGVNAGEGSPVTNAGEIAKRGSYEAATDLFNGQSKATGLLNEAAGLRYSGKAAEEGADLAALGTLAGSAGGAFKNYAGFKYGGG